MTIMILSLSAKAQLKINSQNSLVKEISSILQITFFIISPNEDNHLLDAKTSWKQFIETPINRPFGMQEFYSFLWEGGGGFWGKRLWYFFEAKMMYPPPPNSCTLFIKCCTPHPQIGPYFCTPPLSKKGPFFGVSIKLKVFLINDYPRPPRTYLSQI